MTNLDIMLAAALADPGNLSVRLVYADALEEANRVEQAAYVRKLGELQWTWVRIAEMQFYYQLTSARNGDEVVVAIVSRNRGRRLEWEWHCDIRGGQEPSRIEAMKTVMRILLCPPFIPMVNSYRRW